MTPERHRKSERLYHAALKLARRAVRPFRPGVWEPKKKKKKKNSTKFIARSRSREAGTSSPLRRRGRRRTTGSKGCVVGNVAHTVWVTHRRGWNGAVIGEDSPWASWLVVSALPNDKDRMRRFIRRRAPPRPNLQPPHRARDWAL